MNVSPLRSIDLIDGDAASRERAARLLAESDGRPSVRAWDSAEQFLEDAEFEQIDLLLVDLELPAMGGIECLQNARARRADLRCGVFTSSVEDGQIRLALENGAVVYYLKRDVDRIAEILPVLAVADSAFFSPSVAYRIAHFFLKQIPAHDGPVLTAREREVLTEMSRGLSLKLAGKTLKISPNTVNYHLKNIYKKLGVKNRVEMLRTASDRGIV